MAKDDRTIHEIRKDRGDLAIVTLRKHREERRLMHVMLNEAGVPEFVNGDGVRTCLTGRLNWLILDRQDRINDA